MILLFYRCKSISAMLDSGYNGVKMMLSKTGKFHSFSEQIRHFPS